MQVGHVNGLLISSGMMVLCFSSATSYACHCNGDTARWEGRMGGKERRIVMGAISMILIVAGGLLGVVASIWFLMKAFQESVLWGLGCLIVPFVSFIFLILHWDEAGKPFLLSLGASILCTVGVFMAPDEPGQTLTAAETEVFQVLARM